MLVVQIQVFVLFCLAAKIAQKIFFGKLRPREVENLHDRAWFAVTETCLAMTIFRDEFTSRVVALFGLLLVVKGFHWLCADRVEFMTQTMNINTLFHVRMVAVSLLLAAIDGYLIYYAVDAITTAGPSMQLLSGFEYIVLAVSLITTFIKYLLNASE